MQLVVSEEMKASESRGVTGSKDGQVQSRTSEAGQLCMTWPSYCTEQKKQKRKKIIYDDA